MKHEIPDIIRKNCFTCFGSLNAAERAVILMGDDEYRKSLDLDNDDAVSYTHLTLPTKA